MATAGFGVLCQDHRVDRWAGGYSYADWKQAFTDTSVSDFYIRNLSRN